MKVSRRTFVKYTAGSTLLTLFSFDKLGGMSKPWRRFRVDRSTRH
jgi:hypothetical protein